jgi:hypothetical protein
MEAGTDTKTAALVNPMWIPVLDTPSWTEANIF